MPQNHQILVRRGTTSEWSASTTPLAVGELGYDTVTKQLKVGDGSSLFPALNGVQAGNLNSTLPVGLGGTGRTDGAAPPFLYYTMYNPSTSYAFDLGTAGSVTTTDVSLFGKGVQLKDNTAYEIDMLLSVQMTSPAVLWRPTLSFAASNGLTFQTNGIDINILSYYGSSADTTAVTQTKAEYWASVSALTGQNLTAADLTGSGTYYMKFLIKGVIRTGTNSGTANTGVFTPKIAVTAGTATGSKLRDGSYIKLTPVGTGSANPISIGTWS